MRIAGVNVSGAEYACWQGWGIFDGPTDAASVRAIRRWGANAVSVSLNESCWLGVRGVDPRYSGRAYRQEIRRYVDLLTRYGMVVNLRLAWITDGGMPAAADREHAPRFWRSVAREFKNEPSVMFDLVAEPHPDRGRDSYEAWRCWRDGGTCRGIPYTVAGMQELVDAVRSTRAANPLILTGVRWGNSLRHWHRYRPDDPRNNLVAGLHVYRSNSCADRRCVDAALARLARRVPVVATEIGAGPRSSRDDGRYIRGLMRQLDLHRVGYLVWTWNSWQDYGLNLIADWRGTPTARYGRAVRNHFLHRRHATTGRAVKPGNRTRRAVR